jgi:hypothetical protein
MLPELYHAHLSEKLTRSNYLLTILLIQVVQSIKEVTLESIATKLAMPIKFESRRKKVQRFLSDDDCDLDDIWLSLVIGWIVEVQGRREGEVPPCWHLCPLFWADCRH